MPKKTGLEVLIWEFRKLDEWDRRGMLRPDGSLRVGCRASAKRKGRPRRPLSFAELSAIYR